MWLFVISSVLWSWVVGRCIAFGPKCHGWLWRPRIKATSWYRLTPIPMAIPYTTFPLMPELFLLLSLPTLFIPNTILHVIATVCLTLQHAFLPLFIVHIHPEALLLFWAWTTTFFILTTLVMIGHLSEFYLMATATQTIAFWIFAWFACLQTYIVILQPIVREPPEDQSRLPRTV
jgi:hypothetical protein